MSELDGGQRRLSADLYKVLLQIALLGPEIGAPRASDDLVALLIDLRPDLAHAPIFKALSIVRAGRTNEGIALLRELGEQFPDSQLAKAMLGCCLMASGQSGWLGLFDSVVLDGSDYHALGLVAELSGRTAPANDAADTSMDDPPLPPHALWA